MIFLAALYRVAADDTSFPIWGRLASSTSGAAVTLALTMQNIGQLPFVLSFLGIDATPGAAQTFIKWRGSIQDPSNNTLFTFSGGERANATAAQVQHVGEHYAGGLVLPPRHFIAVTGIFSAGGASNAIAVQTHGYYIPRGSLSLP